MARITYRTRLADLLAKPWITPRDRAFAESLLAHYNKKKYMSAGRARCVRDMEARYASKPVVNSNLLAEVTELRSRIADGSSWDAGFMDSVIGQVNAGRDLSEKQAATVAKVNSRYSTEALAALNAFDAEYRASEGMQTRFSIMVAYYNKTGYYGNITSRVKEGFVPTKKQYEAITANKYATKILAGWDADPKFAVGSMALVRGSRYGTTKGPDGNAAWTAAQNGALPVVIVAQNSSAPSSACKGNKIYKVLPVGCAQTFEVEERSLKAHRIPKKRRAKKSA
tara:strand:- start:1732 stop:2577 length:846 start_codon:yes stop_codon:yes gene_type:complete